MYTTLVREQAIVQDLRHLPRLGRYALRQRIQHRGTRRTYASQPAEEKSFKGQLYDSTHQRLLRERAEQARFAEIREARRPGGAPAWVAPLGE